MENLLIPSLASKGVDALRSSSSRTIPSIPRIVPDK